MPHSHNSGIIIRWIIEDRPSQEEMDRNHLDDLLRIQRMEMPLVKMVEKKFSDLGVSVKTRRSTRNDRRIIFISGSDQVLIDEVKDFFKRHAADHSFEFRD